MDPLLGTIIIFAGNFAPVGYAFCDGSLLSIQQNAALYSLLGTTYGGNGTTNFALPDLRSRVPVGAGQGQGLSNYSPGQTGGAENVTLSANQIPSHTHAAACNTSPGTQASPAGAVWAEGPGGKGTTSPNQYAADSNGTMAASAIGSAGGGQAHTNIQPVLALNYIIATQGVFPSRP